MGRRRILRALLVLSSGSLILVAGASWYVGGTLVSPANRPVPMPDDLPVEAVVLDSDSGAEIATWYVPLEDSTATVVLLHPLGGNRRSMLSRAKLFRDAGCSLVIIDLRAHGESSGDRTTVGYLEQHDVKAAIRYAQQKNPAHRIAVVARSLGGAASLLGSPLQVDALVLESVYPTIHEAVDNRVRMRWGTFGQFASPLLLCQLRPRLGITAADLRPIERMPDVGCPVLVASGDLDLHTTIEETKRLFDAAPEPKQLVVFPGAAHVDLLAHNETMYRASVVDFVVRHLRLHEPNRTGQP